MSDTGKRIVVAALSLSATAFVGLLGYEGYSERAYPDPTYGAKVPTIGFGTTAGVKMGDKTTPVEAVQRALRDVTAFEGAIRQCVKVPLSQGEYDAYAHFAYNVGPGAFCGSTLVKTLNTGDYLGACQQILRWRYSNGQDCSAPGNRNCSGLWQRRQGEYQQCAAAAREAGP